MSLFRDFLNGKVGKQTVFNHVYHQIIMQGAPAIRGTSCVLLDEDSDCKCALGHLLTTNELKIIHDLQHNYVVGVGGICMWLRLPMGLILEGKMSETHSFLTTLQHAHDYPATDGSRPYFIDNFKREMSNVAHEHGLTIPRNFNDENATIT
jgi:hypothetical protein